MSAKAKAIETATGAPNNVVPMFAWPVEKGGKPATHSLPNVTYFLQQRKVDIRLNTFTGLREIRGLKHHDEMSEDAVNQLWLNARQVGLSDSFDTFWRMLCAVSDNNRFHPVLDYLESLKWDGRERLDTWLSTYTGAEDTPLNRAFGRATLIGAVCRVTEPGCKHDTMLVLEGPQGAGKSSILAVLGGVWRTDGLKLGFDAKQTVEATRGRWIIEVPELAGMTNRDIEAVKHQLSCSTDRARMAYARQSESVPRQWIAVGTTNDDTYLRDPTGNRRFLPVRVGDIDLEALKRDRDQLWAEAYWQVIPGGEPSTIPEELWPTAATAQEARRVMSPIEEQITELFEGKAAGAIRKSDLWAALGLGTEGAKIQQGTANTITAAMKKLGWVSTRQRTPEGGRVYVYRKDDGTGAELRWLAYSWEQGVSGLAYVGPDGLPLRAAPCADFEPIGDITAPAP